MKQILLLILLLVETCLHVVATPYCRVRRYDEYDGLSERRVKQIVQDRDGVLWFATWNGLNRFDGYRFDRIRPRVYDEARAFSERFSDLNLTAQGNLWCRIDDRVLLFDTRTYTFRDISSRLEQKFGQRLQISKIHTSDDGHSIFDCKGGGSVVLTDSLPLESAFLISSVPAFNYITPGNRRLGDVSPYRNADLVYSRADSTGRVWVITRDGNVFSAPSAGEELVRVAVVDERGGHFFYSLTDSQGNVWLRGSMGAYRLSMGDSPYVPVPGTDGSVMRNACKDRDGSTWVSLSDLKAVACYGDLSAPPRYLGADGRLHDSFVSFGASVYAFGIDNNGCLWLGCKPEGVYRLSSRDRGCYDIDYFAPDNSGETGPYSGGVYDFECDRYGRLWLAMIDGGIDCVADPGGDTPRFQHLVTTDGYPPSAHRVRDIALAGDTAILAATTGGLLAFPLPAPGFNPDHVKFTLHVSEPGREDAIGNIATMHVLTPRDGNVYVATESDGVNMLPSSENLFDSSARFVRYNSLTGGADDVAYSLAEDRGNGTIWTVNSNNIYNIEGSSGRITSSPSMFLSRDIHFSDARPVNVDDNRWLLGLENGAWVIDFDRLIEPRASRVPLVFTSVSLQNRPDSLLAARTDSLRLSPAERNITVNFSALSYGETENIRYSFSLGSGDWTSLGTTRSVTFLDLDPGTYTLRVRAVDTTGSRPDSEGELVIVVTPTFWETPLAFCLYVLLLLAVIGGIVGTIVYIRRIRVKQRQLLDAYMKLIEKPVTDSAPADEPEIKTVVSQQPSVPQVSETDRLFMQKVVDFVNANIGNSEVGIDEMAAYTATSRSSLNRRMKTLFGVTPADFFKESRLKRAAVLLTETDRSITDIAIECGFADINYFGKCFKASRKVSPTAYRKNNSDHDE